jgi:hypothetical protein
VEKDPLEAMRRGRIWCEGAFIIETTTWPTGSRSERLVQADAGSAGLLSALMPPLEELVGEPLALKVVK